MLLIDKCTEIQKMGDGSHRTTSIWAAIELWLLLSTLAISGLARGAENFSQPLRASRDGHFLMQHDGSPFFFLGENVEYLLWRLDRDNTDAYLKDRARKGFTVIMAHVVPRGDMNLPNAYGQRAFFASDVIRPDPRYFEHVDWVVERAAHYGLRMGLQPLNGIEYVALGKFNLSNVEPYGRWLGERYRDKGIIWILGHDTTPVWTEGRWWDNLPPGELVLKDFRPVYDRMAQALTTAIGHDPFITYHITGVNFPGTPEPRTSLYLADRKWLDMNMLQTSHFKDPSGHLERNGFAFGWNATYGYEPIGKEYDSLPTRPIVDGEAHWEDVLRKPDGLEPEDTTDRWDAVDIRNAAYQSVFAGAAGHSYGHVSVYAFVVPGSDDRSSGFIKYARTPWKEALEAAGARQIGYVKNLMLSRPYFTRIPDQSVIVGNAGAGNAHVIATRDRTGSYMMIYLPEGQPVTIDMNKLSGSSGAGWWFDPRTGESSRIEGEFSTNRRWRFIPPSDGRGNDWVLVLDDLSKGFGSPGMLGH